MHGAFGTVATQRVLKRHTAHTEHHNIILLLYRPTDCVLAGVVVTE
jgi:hypothetical protein